MGVALTAMDLRSLSMALCYLRSMSTNHFPGEAGRVNLPIWMELVVTVETVLSSTM